VTLPVSVRWVDRVLLLIVFAAVILRLQLAGTQEYIHDEINTSIPLARTISFSPGDLHLPLRGENHGALPAYVVKTSSTLFGTAHLGYRLMHVLLSIATILLIYVLARQWAGPVAARWAAALLAFNEYYLAVSSRATAHVPYLFFVAVAIFAFSRFLSTRRPASAYGAAVALGLAFYCKEHAALLLPFFFLALLWAGGRERLCSPHPYLAALVFVALVAPDIFWNLTTNRETARTTYRSEPVGYATYSSHLERIGGLGVSPYPLMFYARAAVMPFYRDVLGTELRDDTPEYPSINPLLGLLLVGAVVLGTVRATYGRPPRAVLLFVFWGIFGFFTLIRPGSPPGRLDPVSWIWVEATMLPAVVLGGAALARTAGARRVAAWLIAGALVLYAASPAALAIAGQAVTTAQESVDYGSSGMGALATAIVDTVRARPLRGVFVAAGVGVLIGFGGGWLARSRRRASPASTEPR
jgi:4-amino-4-deoxy-L-arabinose transferase-like glycosyltransferase